MNAALDRSSASPPHLSFPPQSKLAKLNHEHRELKEKLREERKQAEELWKSKTQLEDERRLQDRTVEQMQRKVNLLQLPKDNFTGTSTISPPHDHICCSEI